MWQTPLLRALVTGGLSLLAGCERVSGLSDLEFECFPDPLKVTCEGLECGEAINNCGEAVACPDTCPPPFACEAGGTPANTCGCTGGARETPPPPEGCVAVPGATENTYYVCDFTSNFAGARATCRGIGADLAVIGGGLENMRVRQALVQNVLLGLTDPGCAADVCALEWVDGSPLGFTAWRAGEPNNVDGAEHCVEMRAADGLWNDISCDGRRGVLCETTCPPPG